VSGSHLDFPKYEEPAYELRMTELALQDLGCSGIKSRADLKGIKGASSDGDIVALFEKKYRVSPRGTEAPIGNLGRADIISLHGPRGGRAATWYDEENGVCWFLGYTPEHDYVLFEQRSAAGELLPRFDDYQVLVLERQTLDFDGMFIGPTSAMLQEALTKPSERIANTVRDLLEITILVDEVRLGEELLRDIYLTLRMPPLREDRPPGWPKSYIAEHLLHLATGGRVAPTSICAVTHVPDGNGGVREIAFGNELAVRAASVRYSAEAPDKMIDDDGNEIIV